MRLNRLKKLLKSVSLVGGVCLICALTAEALKRALRDRVIARVPLPASSRTLVATEDFKQLYTVAFEENGKTAYRKIIGRRQTPGTTPPVVKTIDGNTVTLRWDGYFIRANGVEWTVASGLEKPVLQ